MDRKLSTILASVLGPGDTFIDVGANVGLMTMQAARLVGSGGRVVAVEPQPPCLDLLLQSAALNGFRNVEPHPVALSDVRGQGTLKLEIPENSGSAALRRLADPTEPRGAVETVPILPAGAFLGSLGIRGRYVVKVDVEGHEAPIFESAASYMQVHAPAAILFETHVRREGDDGAREVLSGICRILERCGLRTFAVLKSLLRLSLRDPAECVGQETLSDFLAVDPPTLEDLRARHAAWFGRGVRLRRA